jgi:GNAT superfamily N-acetyltransferase/predicted Ser/Thr protein kinase
MTNETGPTLPARIGKYEVIHMLGRGGMGVVYRARDPRIGRDVAIKTLTAGYSGEPEMLKRFYQEAGNTGNLRHPNIVTVYDFGDEEGLPYIVMEFLEGAPLDKLIRENQLLHMSEKLAIMEQVCLALSYAHGQGMIHRDVKPANIIVQPDGVVKLLDFGIARSGGMTSTGTTAGTDPGFTHTGTLIGTPAYMAPERLRGERFDGRSDIFAAGVVLYQFLAGALPFAAEYPANINQILHDAAPPLGKYLSSYPPQLDEIIARSLAKDPQQRYASASEMSADLHVIGKKLQSQRLNQLVADARTAVKKEDYVAARSILGEVLHADPKLASARKLMSGVERYFNEQKLKQELDEIKRRAQEALDARRWDEAQFLCADILKLHPEDADATALLQLAEAGQQTREQMQQLLRDAEAARRGGDFNAARQMAGKAADLDPSDSRIQAICKILEHEAYEARRKEELRSLLKRVHDQIAAGHLTDASGVLAEAETLSSSDPDLIRLKDELIERLRKEERQRLLQNLRTQAETAITLDQLQAVMASVESALEKHPTEPSLLGLRLKIEPRLREQENRKLIAEVSEACLKLSSTDALARLRDALSRLPGNSELLALESAISQRLTREQRETLLAQYLSKAHELLGDHLYLETVKVLEECQNHGFTSREISELLEMARSAAAERISQELVERNFLEAKALLEEENYDAVLKLLPPILQRVDEPALRRLLDEATRKQQGIEDRVEKLMISVRNYWELGLFDVVVGLIAAEPSGVRRKPTVSEALERSRRFLADDAANCETIGSVYALLPEAECAIAYQRVATGVGPHSPDVAAIGQRLGKRVRGAIDGRINEKLEAAREALRSEQQDLAHDLLEEASAWLASASPDVQGEFKAAQEQLAAVRKVLRFRKARWR